MKTNFNSQTAKHGPEHPGPLSLLAACCLLLVISGCDTGSNWYAELSGLEAYPADSGAWLAWSGDSAASGYEVLYGGAASGITEAQKADVSPEYPRAGIVTASLSGLENGIEYKVWVKATGGNNKEPVTFTVTPQSAEQITTGTYSITEGGIWKLPDTPDDTQTIITISTTAPVIITGGGIGDGTPANYALERYSIRYTVPGANLTIRDIYLVTGTSSVNLIAFTGAGNTLTVTGKNLLEDILGGHACIYVPEDAELTIKGYGTLYMYKTNGAAGIGGNMSRNGTITFQDITFFGKTSHPAALIGGSSQFDQGGDITFLSGEYTMEGNARGSVIGSGAFDDTPNGGIVHIKGGTFNFNIDWAGPAIGGSKNGEKGTVHISGGSIRVYVDSNGASNWGGITGVTDAPVVAAKKNAGDEDTALMKFDLKKVTAARVYNVLVDGMPFYTGGAHLWKYAKENGESVSIEKTPDNWQKQNYAYEQRLFFFLTKQAHAITVNGKSFNVLWDGTKFTGECVWQPM